MPKHLKIQSLRIQARDYTVSTTINMRLQARDDNVSTAINH